jgi:hypothetical protein
MGLTEGRGRFDPRMGLIEVNLNVIVACLTHLDGRRVFVAKGLLVFLHILLANRSKVYV